MFSRKTSRWVLNIFRAEDSTTSLGSLFQWSVTFTVKKFLCMFLWNFLCSNFWPLSLALSLHTTEKSLSLSICLLHYSFFKTLIRWSYFLSLSEYAYLQAAPTCQLGQRFPALGCCQPLSTYVQQPQESEKLWMSHKTSSTVISKEMKYILVMMPIMLPYGFSQIIVFCQKIPPRYPFLSLPPFTNPFIFFSIYSGGFVLIFKEEAV